MKQFSQKNWNPDGSHFKSWAIFPSLHCLSSGTLTFHAIKPRCEGNLSWLSWLKSEPSYFHRKVRVCPHDESLPTAQVVQGQTLQETHMLIMVSRAHCGSWRCLQRHLLQSLSYKRRTTFTASPSALREAKEPINVHGYGWYSCGSARHPATILGSNADVCLGTPWAKGALFLSTQISGRKILPHRGEVDKFSYLITHFQKWTLVPTLKICKMRQPKINW